MNTSDSRFTAHLQAHIRCMKMCSDPSDWRVHINMQRVRQLLTAHFHAHIGHWSHCAINEHIRQSDNCTFTCTHQLHVKCSDTCVWRVHVNVQRVIHLAHSIFHAHFSHMAHSPFTGTHWTVTSVHVYMHTSGACKRAATKCVWRVHVNVQRVRQLAHCPFSCTHRSLGPLPIYMNAPDSRITARLQAHIRCM